MKLSKEQVMVAKGMKERGTSVRQLARQLGVSEGAVRYRLRCLETAERIDGRTRQPTALDGYEEIVEALQKRLGDGRLTGQGRPVQVRELHELLVREHGYTGSYQALVRHLRRKHGTPKVRALRRVETPPGVQAQHDWFEGRRYSVPFAWVGRQVEILGTHEQVVIRGGRTEIARHARGTRQRLLIEAEHYEGPSTDRVERPTPLGRRARLQMAGLSGLSAATLLTLPDTERIARPLDDYVQLVEALR